jgi:hypothetical protein
MTRREKLEAELAEAERALAASWEAVSWRPHQTMNWKFVEIDSQRVRKLHQALTAEAKTLNE